MPFHTDPEDILAMIFSIVAPYILSLFDNLGGKQKAIIQVLLAVVIYGAAANWLFTEVDLKEIFGWAMIASGMGTTNYAVAKSAKKKFWDGRRRKIR